MRGVFCFLLLASCEGALLPHGEARITVDTDLPVRLASRLRIDVYAPRGARWYTSYDVTRTRSSDWPTSFGVHFPSETGAGRALVRLRVYPAGLVRDYHGERFAPRPDPGDDPAAIVTVDAPKGETPRLTIGGQDRTPTSEPEPTAAVDRLVAIELRPGVIREVSVVLRGACAGTMADLANELTCVDTENERVSATTQDSPVPTTRLAGTFAVQEPCAREPRSGTVKDGVPLFDEEVCIQGGPFVFGGRSEIGDFTDEAARPERIAIEPSFFIDKYEVTVGRMRDAIARGFKPNSLVTNDVYQVGGDPTRECTFSPQTGPRESLPVNCLTRLTAREFCRFDGGGDLLSEAQFELAITRDFVKGRYPWGDEPLSCERAVFARFPQVERLGRGQCQDLGVGPAAEDGPHADVTATGVVNLAGNLAELVLDDFFGFRSNCWMGASLLSPRCVTPSNVRVGFRGGSWATTHDAVRSDRRAGPATFALVTTATFRCVRPGL